MRIASAYRDHFCVVIQEEQHVKILAVKKYSFSGYLVKKLFFFADRQTKVVKLRDLYMQMLYEFGMTSLSFLFHQIYYPYLYMDPDYNSPLIY